MTPRQILERFAQPGRWLANMIEVTDAIRGCAEEITCLGRAILAVTRRVAELEEYTARDADAIRDLEGHVRRLMVEAGL